MAAVTESRVFQVVDNVLPRLALSQFHFIDIAAHARLEHLFAR